MANRLFLFCIGGTGARVAKSLAMLLASGCRLGDHFDTVVPILIDPDAENGDLNLTKDILRLYKQIREKAGKPNDFFFHDLVSLNELADKDSLNPKNIFSFNLDDTQNNTFKDFLRFNELSENDKHFIRLLYSDRNLNADLNVGFKGNPNMGSLVLDQFTQSEDFRNFARVFSQGDSIFIVSSIFGGTGAAGFPLLLKTLRANNDDDGAKISRSKIGSLVMLPYFKVGDSETSEIKSSAFEEKAKTAIRYYNQTLIKQQKLEAMYFLGYKGAPTIYQNHEGRKLQKNDAHPLELIGALSILDFTQNIDQFTSGVTQVKEFGLQRETQQIRFKDLDAQTLEIIYTQLTKFRLFTSYLKQGLYRSLGVSRWTKNSPLNIRKTKLTKDFFNSPNYKNIAEKFTTYFEEWMNELDKNRPSFSPYKKITDIERSMDFIIDDNSDIKGDIFKEIDKLNNAYLDNFSSEAEYSQLLKLFSKSTETVLRNNNLLKL